MSKIKDTDLDEQYVAFSLIDCENFITRLYEEELINIAEYEVMSNMINRISYRCGLKKVEEDEH